MVLFYYTMYDEEFDAQEEEDIAMFLVVHKKKKPKHEGPVMGREFIRRERQEAHNIWDFDVHEDLCI